MSPTIRPVRWNGAVIAAVLSIISMAVEMSIRICSSVMFDPLPDAVAVFAYGLIPVTLLLNVGLLRSAEIPTNRLRVLHGAAYAATIISIVVAALYTFSFLVLMPLSLIAILGMGIGFCAWSPLINLIVLCRQLQALKERRRQEEIALPSLSNAVTVCVSALLMIQMVAAPLVIGRAVMEAMYEPAKRASAVTRLRFLHAEDALLTNAGVRNPSFWFQAGAGQFTSIWDSFDDETYRKEPKGAIDAKAVYYLVTGRSASTAPPPSGRRPGQRRGRRRLGTGHGCGGNRRDEGGTSGARTSSGVLRTQRHTHAGSGKRCV